MTYQEEVEQSEKAIKLLRKKKKSCQDNGKNADTEQVFSCLIKSSVCLHWNGNGKCTTLNNCPRVKKKKPEWDVYCRECGWDDKTFSDNIMEEVESQVCPECGEFDMYWRRSQNKPQN